MPPPQGRIGYFLRLISFCRATSAAAAPPNSSSIGGAGTSVGGPGGPGGVGWGCQCQPEVPLVLVEVLLDPLVLDEVELDVDDAVDEAVELDEAVDDEPLDAVLVEPPEVELDEVEEMIQPPDPDPPPQKPPPPKNPPPKPPDPPMIAGATAPPP
jgi:hypothetical protein